ncbi:hypothetical protein O0L34_g4622 [Tuta absoluta]|nr:hypothetical protein O0L34_g4622 [Tuta absoluta]
MRVKFIQEEVIAVTAEVLMEDRMIYLEAAYMEVAGEKEGVKKSAKRQGLDQSSDYSLDFSDLVTPTDPIQTYDNTPNVFQPQGFRIDFKRESVSSAKSTSQKSIWSNVNIEGGNKEDFVSITPKQKNWFISSIFTASPTLSREDISIYDKKGNVQIYPDNKINNGPENVQIYSHNKINNGPENKQIDSDNKISNSPENIQIYPDDKINKANEAMNIKIKQYLKKMVTNVI